MRNGLFWAKYFGKNGPSKQLYRSSRTGNGLDLSDTLHIHTQQNFISDNLPDCHMLDAVGDLVIVNQHEISTDDRNELERPNATINS